MNKVTLNRRTRNLPEWLRQDIPDAQTLAGFRYLKEQGVNTVCLEARFPNWSRCFETKTLAFMILGNRCTRGCQFCAVGKFKPEPESKPNSKNESFSLYLDQEEPYRILKIIKELQLNFVIITSVSRDDLDDYGAGQFVRTINIIRNYKRDIKIEVLIPDFVGSVLNQVVLARPDVLAHNVETVPRLYRRIRREASYQRSLQVFVQTKKISPDLITKSSLLLGMGEKKKEVAGVMDDLHRVGCDILILGQYLAPGSENYPIREFVSIKQFQRYKDIGLSLGFKAVLASPLARTSYQAQEVYNNLQRLACSV